MNTQQLIWNNLYRTAPTWFRDAKFGLFFHWGPYSVPAFENEWYSRNMYAKGLSQNLYHLNTYGPLNTFGYKDFFPLFTGTQFDPEEWAQLVVRSGAKYAGPVTEHADNFSMWDSQVNPINSISYGPKRDIVGECFTAFRKHNIKCLATFHHQWLWGWFMSTDNEADVYDPQNEIYYGKSLPLETNRYLPYRLPNHEFSCIWRDKVIEVIDKYAPDILYFDSRCNIIEDSYKQQIVDHYYTNDLDQQHIITYKQEDFPENIGILDLECGRFSDCKPFPWQTDDRLEDNITWCIVQNPKYKSAKKIIHQLCDVVAKNGNLLLNVGPNADGSFPDTAKSILYEIGDWLHICGEAIYNTRPFIICSEGPTTAKDANYDVNKLNQQLKDGIATDVDISNFSSQDIRFTQNGSALYAISLGWPENHLLTIHSLSKNGPISDIHEITLLGCNTPLNWEQTDTHLSVQLPKEKPCNYAYALKIN